MNPELYNLWLFARAIVKCALVTGLGPGAVVMGLYNFKPRFIARILDGSKTHTIRPRRARPDKPGNTMHLYTGLRHKGARLLMRVPCVKVEEIEIDACGHECNCDPFVSIDGVELSELEREEFARRDGFENFDDMMEFWAGRIPFRGYIFHWQQSNSSGGGRLAERIGEFPTDLGNQATSPSRKMRRSA